MLKEASITGGIIKTFFGVYNEQGYGFLEKVYSKALQIDLHCAGFFVVAEQPVRVYFRGTVIGLYYADMVVENRVIVELTAAESICEAHEAQLLNYLMATDIEVGLLLNFGPKAEFRRKIYDNERKKRLQWVGDGKESLGRG